MGWSDWDDWVKRNASWTGLKNIGREALDPLTWQTRLVHGAIGSVKSGSIDPLKTQAASIPQGYWGTSKAMPFYQKNVVDRGASMVTRPFRLMADPNFRAQENQYSSARQAWRAVNPWLGERQQEWESWNNAPRWDFSDKVPSWSPVKSIGVKGAAEIAGDPMTYLSLGTAGGMTEGALQAGAGFATKRGATRAAVGLGKAAEVAGKAAKVGAAIDNPIDALRYGPAKAAALKAAREGQRDFGKFSAKMAAQGVDNPYAPAALNTATGTMTTPPVNYSLANKGTQNFKWVEMTPGKAFPKGTEYKVAKAGGKQRTFAKVPAESATKWYHGGPEGDLYGGMVTRDYATAANYAADVKGGKGVVREVPNEAVEVATAASKDLNGMPYANYENLGFIKRPPEGVKGWAAKVVSKPGETFLTPLEKGMQEAVDQGYPVPDYLLREHPNVKPKVVQKPLTETVTAGATPNVPPSASGEGRLATTPEMANTRPPKPIKPSATGQDLDDMVLKAANDTKVKMNVQKSEYRKALSEKFHAAEAMGEGKSGEEYAKSVSVALKGELPKQEMEGIRGMLTQAQVDELFDRGKHYYPRSIPKQKQYQDALRKVLDGGPIPVDSERAILGGPLGTDFAQMLYKKALAAEKQQRTMLSYIGMGAREASGAMRILQTILDTSAVLRQGIIESLTHPIESGVKAYAKAVHSMGDVRVAQGVVDAFDKHELSPIMHFADGMRMKVPHISLEGTGNLLKGEEMFSGGTFLRKIPVLKQGIALSERHYSTFLNIQRYNRYFADVGEWAKMYPDLADDILKKGQLSEASYAAEAATKRTAKALKQLDELGDWANIITGRGDLPGFLEKHADTLNTVLYASKLLSARVGYVPKGLVYSVQNPILRKQFARELVTLTGSTIGILAAAKALGADVEADPRSVDFGKIRIGNTRIDFMGGFQPYIRYTAQFMTGEKKTAEGISKVNRGDTFARFLRSKESPVAGLVHDMWSGETFIGESSDLSKETLARTAYSKFTPLFVQDVIDSVKEEGAAGAAMASPGFLGANVLTYKTKAPGESAAQTVVKPLAPEQIIENQVWAQNPYWKTINDQIKLAEETYPGSEARLLKKYPKLVQIRKEIASRKRMLKGRSWQNKTVSP